MPQICGSRKMLARGLLALAPLAICCSFLLDCSDLKAAEPREALLVWSSPPEEDVAGYTVHYGQVSRYETAFRGYAHALRLEEGDYVESDRLVEYRLTGLDPDVPCWVSVTAFDRRGNESSFSNEKGIGLPAPPPVTGCQSMPGLLRHGAQAGAPVWILVYVSVSFWIVGLRRKMAARAVPRDP